MKTLLITGADSGIGFATTKYFLEKGWHVIGTSLTGSVEIESLHLTIFQLDLRSKESIRNVVTEIQEQKHSIDILINNAGVLLDFGETAVKSQMLRDTLEVNLIGLIDLTEKLIPFLNSTRHIINIGSMAGAVTGPRDPNATYPAYRISKAAVHAYTRLLAKRLEDTKVTVSALDPGWVRTDMGGPDAPRLPEEVARDLFELATRSGVPTGHFWHKGEQRDW